jgi:UDP-GlcNAc:undecaprenyl-phosphate GlcNAc-1-phosphate transferase
MNIHVLALSVVLLSLLGAYTLLWLFLRTPVGELFKDAPGRRKVHQRTVPRMGGVCIILSFLGGLFLWRAAAASATPGFDAPLFTSVVFASLTILLIGILDDTFLIEIQNRAKFLLETLIAIEIVYILGIRLETISFFGAPLALGWIGGPLTVFWLVGVSNAVNIIDGVDGLAAGIALITLAAVSALALLSDALSLAFVAGAAASAAAGFLAHNRPPARVFLGDAGSLFLGMVLGLTTVRIVSNPVADEQLPVQVALLLAGLPILDVSAAMVRRFAAARRKGGSAISALLAMTVADSDHMHHRLLYYGLTHAQTAMFLGFAAASFCAAALVTALSSILTGVLITANAICIAGWLLFRLDFLHPLSSFLKSIRPPNDAAAPRHIIGVISADDVFQYALSHYDQTAFTFLFLESGEHAAAPHHVDAFILVNTEPARRERDRIQAHAIAARTDKPVMLIAESLDDPADRTRPAGRVFHAARPIYIPALVNELYTLTSRRAEPAAARVAPRLIAKAHPVFGWIRYGKEFSKR